MALEKSTSGSRRGLGRRPWHQPDRIRRARGRRRAGARHGHEPGRDRQGFLAREQGGQIPETWAVDEHGAPTSDPELARSAVPLGGYKGYGLALMVEVLSGLLAGAGFTHSVGDMYNDFSRTQDVGHFVLALDPERTVGRDTFADALESLLAELRANPPAPGFDEVLVAGDPEQRAEAERGRAGVPLPASLFETLTSLSRELGVEAPDARE